MYRFCHTDHRYDSVKHIFFTFDFSIAWSVYIIVLPNTMNSIILHNRENNTKTFTKYNLILTSEVSLVCNVFKAACKTNSRKKSSKMYN